MNRIGLIAFMCVGSLVMIHQQAKADEADQKTIFTFSEPVEIPGQVLAAGTYVFKIADNGNDRDVVEVMNKDETHLIAMFLAIPDQTLTPSGKTIINFEERAAGAPQAVRAWFYPGVDFGHEFVYPKTKAQQLAKANKRAVPSMPDEMKGNSSASALKATPVKAQNAAGKEVGVNEAFSASK